MKFKQDKSNLYWREYEFLSLDIETTGLDLKEDEVISIGAVTIRDGRIVSESNFYEEISPEREPSKSAMQVHGLRAIDLANARPAHLVVSDLIQRWEGKYLIAHAGWIERAFLTDHFKQNSAKFPARFIDTAALARHLGHADSSSGHEPSLESLARNLGLPSYTPHHALGDAMTTAVVFLALVSQIERQRPAGSQQMLTLSDLLRISRE